MQIDLRWNFDRDARGRRRVARVPVWNMHTWAMRAGPDMLRFRPTLRTFGVRLAWTLLMAAFIIFFYWSLAPKFGPPPPPRADPETAREIAELEQRMVDSGMASAETLAQKRAESSRRLADIRARNAAVTEGLHIAFLTIASVLSVLGVYPLVSLLWERLTFRRGFRGPEARRRGLLFFGGGWAWPTGGLGPAELQVREALEREPWSPRYSTRYVTRGWDWTLTVYGNTPGGLAAPAFILVLAREATKPGSMRTRPPERVEQALQSLEAILGMAIPRAWTVAEFGPVERGLFSNRRAMRLGGAVSTAVSAAPTATVQQFSSLEEMPPELRAQAEALLAEGGGRVEVAESTLRTLDGELQEQQITYRDRHGHVHTFRSVNQMPPELRAKYEAFQRARGGPGPGRT